MRRLRIKFIDGGEEVREVFLATLSSNYDVEESDDPEIVVFGDAKVARHKAYNNCLKFYVAIEYQYPNYNLCDYSLSFLNLNISKNLRFPYYVWENRGADLIKQTGEEKEIISEKTKFCAFVASNGNKNRAWKRLSFFHKLSKYKKVDSGGRFLNNIGYQIPNSDPRYKSKVLFYRPYKFVIAFENMNCMGYTTEKIVHAMQARSIPIFWGNPEIEKDFNPKSFINLHDYRNDKEVIDLIMEIDGNQKLYEQYLREPFFYNNKPNELYDLKRLRTFLVKAIESPRHKREVFGYIPFKWLDLKKRIKPYWEKFCMKCIEE